jgi:hypothetical protein
MLVVLNAEMERNSKYKQAALLQPVVWTRASAHPRSLKTPCMRLRAIPMSSFLFYIAQQAPSIGGR